MTVMRERRNVKRRGLMVLAGVVALFLGSGAAGYAWWQVQGHATINVSAATLDNPTVICRNINDGVRLEWAPNPPGVTGYQLEVAISHPRKGSEILYRENLSAGRHSRDYTDQVILDSFRESERITGIQSKIHFRILAAYPGWERGWMKNGFAFGHADLLTGRVTCQSDGIL